MATYNQLKSSLRRAQESLERLRSARTRIERRTRGIENRLVEFREALKTGRGQTIRGQLTRTLRLASAIEQDLELQRIRAERLDFKARNLKLDAKFDPAAHTGQPQQTLITQSQEIRNAAAGFISSYENWLKQTQDRIVELKRYSINAEWHYKIDLCIDAFRTGYDELGLTNLMFLVYGPNTPPSHRRRALGELLSWGHTIQNLPLINLANSHTAAYRVSPDRYAVSERELVLRIEAQIQLHPFEHQDGLLLFLEAIKQGTEDAFLAAANLAATAELAEIPGFGKKLQIEWVNRALAASKLEPIFLNEELSDTTFDQVDCNINPESEIANGPLVSVIVPAWNSANWLPTAIRGLQKQSWKNLEIIIVDDFSTDDTLSVAKGLAATDKRIKVLANDANRGAYASRNWGAQVSSGEYITVHDADDWSHPRKIERQVNYLTQNPNIVADLSQSVRVEPGNLVFFAQYGREYMRQNSSSVLFARDTVFKTLGYWDEVKFGADTEFHHRIRAAYGAQSAPIAHIGLLSLTRYHAESLTGGGEHATQRGISGARREYLGNFDRWHAEGKAQETTLYLDRGAAKRPFPIPFSSALEDGDHAHFDLLVIANLAIDTAWLLSVYKATKKLTAQGKKVAFIHMPGLLRPTQQPSATLDRVLLDPGAIRIYNANDCIAELAWMQASALAARNKLMPQISSKLAEIVVDEASLEVHFDRAAALAAEYVGVAPTLHVSDRECMRASETWKGLIRPAVKIWKAPLADS
jgi:hypothetical protein